MSQSVDRLKELLFDTEARALDELSRRLDDVTSTGEQKFEIFRSEFAQRLDHVYERAGTQERFLASVSGVLDGALRDAEIDRHAELSEAIAPLVVRTIKTEIRNSQDELAEALYPMMGQMVKQYVSSAIKDLNDEINRRIEQNALMLRLRSMSTGRSVAELAMADTGSLEVEELFLIQRGTGALVARWPEINDGGGNIDHVMSGVLTAINEFATEAFGSGGSSLRQIDLGNAQVYLRASPSHMLAAKCAGSAPPAIEQFIDDQFLKTIEDNQTILDAQVSGDDAREAYGGMMSDLATRLGDGIANSQDELRAKQAGFNPLKVLAWLIALPLIAWVCWGAYVGYMETRVRDTVQVVIAADPRFEGYPLEIDVAYLGRSVNVNGLAPSPDAKSDLLLAMRSRLDGVEVTEALSILPSGLADAERVVAPVKQDLSAFKAEVLRQSVARALDRSRLLLDQAAPDLAQLKQLVGDSTKRDLVAGVTSSVSDTSSEIDDLVGQLTPNATSIEKLNALAEPISQLEVRLRAGGDQLSSIQATGDPAPTKPNSGTANEGDIVARAEALSAQAQRLAIVAASVTQAALKPLPVAPKPTARQNLQAWIDANAIFFSDNVAFRDPQAASEKLNTLAGLINQADAFVRVVGYTDARGAQQRNTTLSQARADKVRNALLAARVPEGSLVAIGRLNARDISPKIGTASANRRVEFELGFVGEGAR